MSAPSPFWKHYSESITKALGAATVTDQAGASVDIERAFDTLVAWTKALQKADGTLHMIGNGASASMASHMALDWTKNAKVRAAAYNDAAFLTAIGNDLGYENVFAGPVAWYARPKDILATVSSSGNSPSIIRAIDAARKAGCQVITFSGMSLDNASRSRGDLNVFVPAFTYGIVESAHSILLHAWLDHFMDVREWEATARQTIPPR